MKRRVNGRGLALSTVIKLIFEGLAGTAYLTVFIRRELPRTRHRGLRPHNAFCEDSPFRAASAVQSSLHVVCRRVGLRCPGFAVGAGVPALDDHVEQPRRARAGIRHQRVGDEPGEGHEQQPGASGSSCRVTARSTLRGSLLKLRAFAIILLSIALAACGSGSGTMPADSGADRTLTGGSDYERPPTGDVGVDSAAQWTLTDGGECIGPSWPPVYAPCTLDEHPCGGQSVCRSCNAGLGLWKIMPVWSCVCANATVNGSTGLYWQCPSLPVCTLGPDTFVDSQCTEPAGIDAGVD